MKTTILDGVIINPKEKGSIAYAKARAAIEQAAECRNEQRQAKQTVIEYLRGTIADRKQGKFGTVQKTVTFPDNSQAKY